LTLVKESLDHRQWLEEAFRGQVPEEISRLQERRATAANVLEEMKTAMDPKLRKAVEHLYDLHNHETELMYAVVEHLFKRHLEGHPSR